MKHSGYGTADWLIDSYRQRRGLPARIRDVDGRLAPTSGKTVLVFDRRYRIELIPQQLGRVLLQGRLMVLPAAGPQRDAAVLRLGRLGLWSATRHAASCVVDADARGAWLQLLVSTDTDAGGQVGTPLGAAAGMSSETAPHVAARQASGSDTDVDAFVRAVASFVDAFAAWRAMLSQPEAEEVEHVSGWSGVFHLTA